MKHWYIPILTVLALACAALVFATRAECYVCGGGPCGSQSECITNCVCAFPPGQSLGTCVGGTP